MNLLVVAIAYLLGAVTVLWLGVNTVGSFFDGIRDFLNGLAPPGPPF